jgi:hypothetical protein
MNLGLSLGLPFSRVSEAEIAPGVAPALDVQTALGSDEASLTWTASNRTGSPGFGYKVEVDIDGGGFNERDTTTGLSYTDTQGTANGETYTYRVTPFNDYGEGPSSNEVGVVLPGESEGPVLTGPENANAADYTIEWTAIAGAANYQIYTSLDDGDTDPYTLFDEVASDVFSALMPYRFPDPLVGVYHYIIAVNGAFESAPSNTLYVENSEVVVESPRLAINAGGNILLNAGGAILIN